ncbi:MAG: DUF1905 domain-containing protein [Chitinophagaceae bacterium]|nr:MAG: DUF1905 domain-containing protein [Chitinophagaceae bacterium]
MVECKFEAMIRRYAQNGDKTNWTFIRIPAKISSQLSESRKGFRVSGWLDGLHIEKVALIPEGGGNFILPLNNAMRKQIRKPVGEKIMVSMIADLEPPPLDPELIQCLRDEPEAWAQFSTLTPSHQRYFSTWVASAKTTTTRDKRIAHSVDAMMRKWDYGQMIRALKKVD